MQTKSPFSYWKGHRGKKRPFSLMSAFAALSAVVFIIIVELVVYSFIAVSKIVRVRVRSKDRNSWSMELKETTVLEDA